MSKEKALVSVIISTFNRKDYIGKAIDSVLMQTYKDVEIIMEILYMFIKNLLL